MEKYPTHVLDKVYIYIWAQVEVGAKAMKEKAWERRLMEKGETSVG